MATQKADPAAADMDAMAAALDAARRADGLSQCALADRLGTSQANVCKLLRGRQRPQPRLAQSIRGYLGLRRTLGAGGTTERTERLLRAYETSPAFRSIVDAAMSLLNENE